MVCTPMRAASANTFYTAGLLNSHGLLGAWVPLTGQSDLYVARNVLVNEFLSQPTFHTMVFIDSDIGFLRDDLARLLSHEEDIVTGCYPGRSLALDSVVKKIGNTRLLLEEMDAPGLIEVSGIPMGFVKITRAALLKMIAHGHLEPYGKKTPFTKHQFFNGLVLDDELCSEDISFSHLARVAGVKLYADGHIRLNHDGYCFPPPKKVALSI
jgi:hypothetical protein